MIDAYSCFIPGLVSVSFREKTPEQIIKETKENGLKAIEWGSDVHAKADDIEGLRKIARLQSEAGIICCSYGTYLKIGFFTDEMLLKHIEAARILGTNVLRIWAGNKGSREFSEEEKKSFFSECSRIARIAERENVTLCLECHNNTYTDYIDGAYELIAFVNSKAFRMYFQPNQWRTDEENLAYIKKMSEYTVNLHVFAREGNTLFPLSKKEMQWEAYFSALNGTHYALLEFMPDNENSTFLRECKTLVNIIGNI